MLESKERLTAPLKRDSNSGVLKPVTWNEAFQFAVDSIKKIQANKGKDAIACFGGGALTNEKAYSLGKFARVALQTKHIDYNGRFCMASGALANQKAFGIDRGLPFALDDISKAEVVILAGANPANTMPPIMQYFDRLRENGGKLIVIDPRRSDTAAYADCHVQIAPGSDLAFFNGLLYLLIKNKALDYDFIQNSTRGFDQVSEAVKYCSPDVVERITGVPVSQLHLLVDWLATAKRVIALSGRGIEQQTSGVNNDLALINILLALGMVGKEASGFGCLTGQGNGQGGREHGQKADQLPGYRKISNLQHRQHVASHWGIAEHELPQEGLPACEMFSAFGESIAGLLIFGANPVVSAPNSAQFLAQLKRLQCLIVCDAFLSDTAQHADLVLPVSQWAEERGTLTNLEGRLLYREALRAPPDGVMRDLDIMSRLAEDLACKTRFESDPEIVFDELCRVSKGGVADYSALSHARIKKDAHLFWPAVANDEQGSERVFANGFYTEDGLAHFHATPYRQTNDRPNDRYPFYITTGRVLLHYQTRSQTRQVPELLEEAGEAFVEIHPQIAATYNIKDQSKVKVTSVHGSAEVTAVHNEKIRMDTLFLPFHWGGSARANLLTGNQIDPESKIPAFKYCIGSIETASGHL